MQVIEESIAGVDAEGNLVTGWVAARREGLLGVMERVVLKVDKPCTVHKIVCTDGSSHTLVRPYHLEPDYELRFGCGIE